MRINPIGVEGRKKNIYLGKVNRSIDKNLRSNFSPTLNKDTISFSGINNLTNKPLIEKLEKDITIAMTNCLYGLRPVGHHSPKGYANAAANFDIKNFLTLGGESAVFSLEDGTMLKMSISEYNPYLPKFHAPEKRRGVITLSKKYPIIDLVHPSRTTDTFYYVIQEKGELNVLQRDIDDFLRRCEKAGHPLVDIKHDQFAYFNINGIDEVRFIDLGCIDTLGNWK